MKYVFFKINFSNFVKIFILIIKKKEILYLFKSKFTNYIFDNLKLEPKNCTQIKWNFNNIKEDSMLLGYKVEIYYLNKFIDDFIKFLSLTQTKQINVFLKKDLLYFKVFNNVSLFQFLYCVLTLKNNYQISTILIPKTKYSKFYENYFKENFDIKIESYFDLLEYIQSYLNILKLNIKKLLKDFLLNKKNIPLNSNNIDKISIEVALNVFKPQHLFNKISPSKIIFVNKIHKLSNFDSKNLKLSKKNFFPMYNFNEKNISLSITEIQYFKKKFKIENSNFYSENFIKEFFIWLSYFRRTNTKLYLTNYKYSSHIIPASSAINEHNGISSMFQTSFYEKTSPYSIFLSDIYFSFSNKFNYAEELIGSSYKYNVSVGYTYDYKFENAKKNSISKSEFLHNHGAKKIVSFFDQGAIEDNQFTAGYMHIRESYKFLLNKLFRNEWLGLIIKPKKPALLKKSLGPAIYNLLLEAQKTNRCIVYLNSDEILTKNFENPPCEAAFASDISIHNCLVAGTAGIESALTGKESIFFDYYGFRESIFYNKGNNIVFTNWDELWEYLIKKINHDSKKIESQWTNIIQDIDPFRDGNAFSRIEEFSNNIISNFKKCKSKQIVLEETIKTYINKWGSDKVLKFY